MTERANEVDDHLNYLLGRLSLVVHGFNQVRGGLGEALESLRVQNLPKQADSQVRRPVNPLHLLLITWPVSNNQSRERQRYHAEREY